MRISADLSVTHSLTYSHGFVVFAAWLFSVPFRRPIMCKQWTTNITLLILPVEEHPHCHGLFGYTDCSFGKKNVEFEKRTVSTTGMWPLQERSLRSEQWCISQGAHVTVLWHCFRSEVIQIKQTGNEINMGATQSLGCWMAVLLCSIILRKWKHIRYNSVIRQQ